MALDKHFARGGPQKRLLDAVRADDAVAVAACLAAGALPLAEYPKDYADAGGWTAFERAGLEGCFAAFDVLLARGTPVDRADAQGRTVLHLAAEDGLEDIVVALLARGAAVGAKDHRGATPLAYAAKGVSVEAGLNCCRLLLEAGADPHEAMGSVNRGIEPILAAARAQRAASAQLELTAGAGRSRA